MKIGFKEAGSTAWGSRSPQYYLHMSQFGQAGLLEKQSLLKCEAETV